MTVERFDVKHTECLVDIVGSYRRSSSMTHKPSFFVLMSTTMTPSTFGMLAALTSSTWCILYSTSLARAGATASGKPVTFRYSAMSWGVHDQHTQGSTKRPCSRGSPPACKLRLPDQPRLLVYRFAHFEAAFEGSQRWGDGRVGEPWRSRSSIITLFRNVSNRPREEGWFQAEVKTRRSQNPPLPPEPVNVPTLGDEGWEDEDSGDGSESDKEDDLAWIANATVGKGCESYTPPSGRIDVCATWQDARFGGGREDRLKRQTPTGL